MCMRQEDGVDACRIHRKRIPVSLLEVALLVESAIDEKSGAIDIEKVARARNILGGAKKLQFHGHILLHYYGSV